MLKAKTFESATNDAYEALLAAEADYLTLRGWIKDPKRGKWYKDEGGVRTFRFQFAAVQEQRTSDLTRGLIRQEDHS